MKSVHLFLLHVGLAVEAQVELQVGEARKTRPGELKSDLRFGDGLKIRLV
jgi:hypothetical protein